MSIQTTVLKMAFRIAAKAVVTNVTSSKIPVKNTFTLVVAALALGSFGHGRLASAQNAPAPNASVRSTQWLQKEEIAHEKFVGDQAAIHARAMARQTWEASLRNQKHGPTAADRSRELTREKFMADQADIHARAAERQKWLALMKSRQHH